VRRVRNEAKETICIGERYLLTSCHYSDTKVFSINSYIPKKQVGAIVLFDRARRALRRDLIILRRFFTIKIIIINEVVKYF